MTRLWLMADGKYRTIVADPPWDYPDGVPNNPKGRRNNQPFPYAGMSTDEIEALPVRGLADRDCRLFLWTTNRYLHDAFHVLGAWGFTFAQVLV